MIKTPNTKTTLFRFFLFLTLLYALLIFYLSSLSSPGDPEAIKHFLKLNQLEKLIQHTSMAFLFYPLYIFAEYPDKTAHMFLYAGFGFLLYYTLKNSSSHVVRNYAPLFTIFLGLVYGATDEFHQSFVPGRTASLWDLFADVLGITLAQALIFIKNQLSSSRKKITTSNFDLKIILVFIFLSILFILFIPFDLTSLRIILVLPLLLFLPGYLIMSIIFPGRCDLSPIEKFTRSIGISIALTVFDAFALNYTSWGFRLDSIVFSLSIIMGILLIVAYYQRWKYNEAAYDFSSGEKTSSNHPLKSKVLGIRASIWNLIANGIRILLFQAFIFIQKQLSTFHKKNTASTLDLKIAIVIIVLSILFILFIPFDLTSLRIILMLPLLLFLPGYLIMSIIFPGRCDLSPIEKFTRSIGISIALTVFDAFALNYTSWGFRLDSIVFSLSIIMGILLIVAYYQRWKYNEAAYDFSSGEKTSSNHPLKSKVLGISASIWNLIANGIRILLSQAFIFIQKQLSTFRKKNTASTLDFKIAIVIIVLSILFILVPPFNQTFLRILLALPLLLFLPGYLFILAIFPRRGELSTIERFTLSIGLSITITVFDGFVLNYTPWGFRSNSILISLSIIMGILLLIAYYQRRVHNETAYDFSYGDITSFYQTLKTKETDSGPGYDPAFEKMLIKTMIIAILLISAMLIYAKVTIEPEKFTTLYILGANGKAENYPAEIYIGEPSTVMVGVENYEYEPVNYTLVVKLGGNSLKEQYITLNHENKWLNNVTFFPLLTSSIAFTNRSKLEFLLLKDNETYRSVHLWVNISFDKVKFVELPNITNGDMEWNNGWIFSSNSKNITGNYSNNISRSRVYEIHFTTEEAGQQGTIYQNLTTYGDARAVLSFNVRDSQYSNASYYVFKQALLDGKVVWESGAGGKKSNWEHIEIPLFLSGNNNLAFRIYSKYSTNYNVTVWWDNVKLRSYGNLSQSGDLIEQNDKNININSEMNIKFFGFYEANNLSLIKLSVENIGNKAKSFDLTPAPVMFDDIGNKYEMVRIERGAQIAQTTLYPGVIRTGYVFFKPINSSANQIQLILYINGEKYEFSFKAQPAILEEVKEVAFGETINNSGLVVGLYGFQNNQYWNSKVFIAVKNTDYEEKPFKLSPASVLVDDRGYQYDRVKVQGAPEIEQVTIYPGVIRKGSIYFRDIKPDAKNLKLILYLNGEKYPFNFSVEPKILNDDSFFNNTSNNITANANIGETISTGAFDLRLTAYQNTPNWNSMVVIAVRNLGDTELAFKLTSPPVLLDDLGNQYDVINRERANQIRQTVIYPGVIQRGNIYFKPIAFEAKYIWLIIYLNGEKYVFGFKAQPRIIEDNGIPLDVIQNPQEATIGEAISKEGFEVNLKEFQNTPDSISMARISVRNMESDSKLLTLNPTTVLIDDLGNQYEMVNVIRGDQIEQTTIVPHAMKEGNIFFEPVKKEAKYIKLLLRINSGKYVFGFEQKYNTS